jgi:hypothetical protein
MIDTLVRLLPKAEIKELGPQLNRKDKSIQPRLNTNEIPPQYDLPDLPWLNTLRCPSELNGARRGRHRLPR